MRMGQLKTALCGVACLAVLAPAAAQAEGSWTSSMHGVKTGFETRDWADGNRDGAGTVTSFRHCHITTSSGGVSNIRVRLLYNNTWTPDETMSNNTYYCSSGTWQRRDHGRLKKGSYHETLTYVNGQESFPAIDVDGVSVSY